MVAPTFKKVIGGDPGTTSKYGAPDLKYVQDVLDGSHLTDRIQMDFIEGREKNASPFLFLIRQVTTSSFQAIRGTGHPGGNPGSVEFAGAEFKDVINSAISSLPDDASTAEQSQGIIYIQGSRLNVATNTININRAVTIDGLGTAIIAKTNEFTGTRTAIIQCARSNITLRNFTIYDEYQNPNAYPQSNSLAQVVGITCSPPSQHPRVRNLLIENIFFKNIYMHAIDLSVSDLATRSIDHATIRNCIADHSGSNTTFGSSFNIGLGVRDTLVQHNKIYECGHTGIDIWGVFEHVKCIDNYVYKTLSSKVDGSGIALVRYADHLASQGLAEDILIQGNRVYGPINNDGISVHAQARKVIVANNFVDGTLSDGISVRADNIEGTDLYARETIIQGNIIRNTGNSAIVTNVDPALAFHGIVIIGNLIFDAQRHGINVASNVKFGVINSNSINGYGLSGTAGPWAGIHLRIAKNCVVNGNTIYGTATNAANSILEEVSGSASNIITSNNCNKAISLLGGNNTVSANNIVVAA